MAEAAPPPKAYLDLPTTASLQVQQTGLIAQLWAIFVTATFAAAVLNVTSSTPHKLVSIAITVGFLFFALGHFMMIRQALRVSRELCADIEAALAADRKQPFARSVAAIASTAYWPYFSYAAHVAIDACVVASIWSKHLAAMP